MQPTKEVFLSGQVDQGRLANQVVGQHFDNCKDERVKGVNSEQVFIFFDFDNSGSEVDEIGSDGRNDNGKQDPSYPRCNCLVLEQAGDFN